MVKRLILVDSREKVTAKVKPLSFTLPTKRCKLDTGDYSIWGYKGLVTVEHKRWYDYVGCCSTSRGWKKFREGQLTRLADYDNSIILVTSHLDSPMSSYSLCKHETIYRRTAYILSHFKIPVIFTQNERIGSIVCQDYLTQVADAIDRL